MRPLCLAVLLSIPVENLAPGAANGGVGELISGVVYDGACRCLRPVMGAPGSAFLGEPLAGNLDGAWVAPDGDQALVLSGESLFWLKGLKSRSLEWLPLPVPGAMAALVGWRADSTAAAIYTPGSLTLVHQAAGVLAGFSTEPLGGRISALAVADDAVLAGVEGVGLYRLSAAGEMALLGRLIQPSAIVPAGPDRLLVADRARGEILQIRRWRDSAEILPFASFGAGDPAALAVLPNGRSVLVLNSAGRRITILDQASGALIRELPLEFEAARLEPLGDGASWLLTERRRASEAFEVLSVVGEPAVFFIPAPAEDSIARQE